MSESQHVQFRTSMNTVHCGMLKYTNDSDGGVTLHFEPHGEDNPIIPTSFSRLGTKHDVLEMFKKWVKTTYKMEIGL